MSRRPGQKQERPPDGRRKTVAAARDDIQAGRRKLIDQVKDQSPVHPPGSRIA